MAKNQFIQMVRERVREYWAQFRIYNRIPNQSGRRSRSLRIHANFVKLVKEVHFQSKRLRGCRNKSRWSKLVEETEAMLAAMNHELSDLKQLQFQEARDRL